MSDTNRVAIRVKEETTFAADPPPSTNWIPLLFSSENLGQDTRTTTSATIRSDRQVQDVPRTSISAAGDINMEFIHGNHDLLVPGILQASAFTSAVTVGPKLLTVASATITGAASDFTAIAVGEIVRIKDGANDKGYYRVLSKAGDSSSLTMDRNITAGSYGTGDESVRRGAQAQNGVVLTTFAIEKFYTDLATTFELLLGCSPNTWVINGANEGLITQTIGYLGKKALSKTATSAASLLSEASALPMNTIDHVFSVISGGVALDVTSFGFNLNNNNRLRPQIATLGPISIGTGQASVTGSIEAYFTSATKIDEYLNYTATDLTLTFKDADGNAHTLDLPHVKFTNARRVAGGANQDVIAVLDYVAFRDPVFNATVRYAITLAA